MTSIFTLSLLSCLGLAAALTATSKNPLSLFRRQGSGGRECETLSGGPGEGGKQAVGDFFRNTYITGKACPQGNGGNSRSS